MEELNLILEMAEEAMNKALEHLNKSFTNIRAGKANPVMLSSVKVDYYGTQTPLNQVANVNTLMPKPFLFSLGKKYLSPRLKKPLWWPIWVLTP